MHSGYSPACHMAVKNCRLIVWKHIEKLKLNLLFLTISRVLQKRYGRPENSQRKKLKLKYFFSCDSNEYSKEITAVDVGRGNIVTFNAEQRSIIRHHSGISNQGKGIVISLEPLQVTLKLIMVKYI